LRPQRQARPDPGGGGYGAATQLGIFPALRSISKPNFIKIGAVVWISIADIHTHIDFYMLDRVACLSDLTVLKITLLKFQESILPLFFACSSKIAFLKFCAEKVSFLL